MWGKNARLPHKVLRCVCTACHRSRKMIVSFSVDLINKFIRLIIFEEKHVSAKEIEILSTLYSILQAGKPWN